MSNNEVIDIPEFIRHIQFGPGKVMDYKSQKVIVKFCDTSGKLEENTYQYELSDWKIKEIPENSLGALLIKTPAKVFSLVGNQDPKIIELCLKESKGKAKQMEIRALLEPLIKARGHKWNKWWKRIGQILRNYKFISFDKREKTYNLHEIPIQEDGLSRLNKDDIQIYELDTLADLSHLVIKNRLDFKNLDKTLTTSLWDRLCQVFEETSPKGRKTSEIIALGDVLSDILTVQKKWLNLVKKWIENEEVNLLGTRDAKVRAHALQTLGSIDWPKKRETLGSYILNEESSEKNRVTASRLLWHACNNTPQEYFDVLIEATKKLQISAKNPLIFLTSRAKRVLNSSIEFIRSIQGFKAIEAFCASSGRLLTSFFTKTFQPPLDSRPTKDMLNLWLEWKTKVEDLLLAEDKWIVWINSPILLRFCSEHARKRFFEEQKETERWTEYISNKMIEQANTGHIEYADTLYDLTTLMSDSSKAERIINSTFESGAFTSAEAQEWALSHTIKSKQPAGTLNGQDRVIEEELAKLAFHPREREISTNVARLLLLVKEREPLLSEVVAGFEELARLYEPTRMETVQELKSFQELLINHLENLRSFLRLEYIGKAGSIETYNPNKHQLLQETTLAPKYVEIVCSGVARRQKDGLPEVLQKAIVKPATGGSL